MSVYCGRSFSADDIETIRVLISQDPNLTRAALSRKLCVLWQWLKPNGELKDMTCRVALARMHGQGLIVLPPSRLPARCRGRPNFPSTPASDPQIPIGQPTGGIQVEPFYLMQTDLTIFRSVRPIITFSIPSIFRVHGRAPESVF